MIQNLNQLKRALKPGVRFEIVGHVRPDCIGEIRVVTKSGSIDFYSGVYGDPAHKASRANNGLGSWLNYGKAGDWKFADGLCERIGCMTFRILED